MPIDFPTYSDVINRVRSDVAKELPELDPNIFGSIIRAFSEALASRSFDIVLLLQQLLKQFFPQTADDEFIELWAAYERLTRNNAATASGPITVTGTTAATIPIYTVLTSANGNQYKTQTEVTLAPQIIGVTSLTRLGSIVTATTASDHNLASNMQGTIAGANETDYNGTFKITVTSATTFTYSISGTPATPATGTVTFSFTGNFVTIKSDVGGQDQNLASGAKFTLSTPISGVDTSHYAQFDGISEGTDEETDTALLSRVLQSRSNPVANFNVPAIEKAALSIPGVTRVKVKRITPAIGDVTVLFVRDDDIDIIPSATEVQTVYDAVVAISPVNTPESSIYVVAPTPVTTDYVFTIITPDTSTMREAITASIEAFYRDTVTFETDITEIQYNSAIIDTVDPVTGDKLENFTLSGPSGNIVVGVNSIGVIGDILFP